MTELFRELLLRAAVAGICSAAALRAAGSGALREVVRFAAGLLMLLAVLQPLARFRLPVWQGRDGAQSVSAAQLEEENAQTVMNALGANIAKTLEKRAAGKGLDCEIAVDMGTDEEGLLQIEQVTVRYRAADAGRLDELRALLTEECGVSEDRQELIER